MNHQLTVDEPPFSNHHTHSVAFPHQMTLLRNFDQITTMNVAIDFTCNDHMIGLHGAFDSTAYVDKDRSTKIDGSSDDSLDLHKPRTMEFPLDNMPVRDDTIRCTFQNTPPKSPSKRT